MSGALAPDATVAVLGGGQLGRMLAQAGMDFGLRFRFLDPDAAAPCRAVGADFVVGDLHNAAAVYAFAQGADVVTVEIENVSADALDRLVAAGQRVYPQPEVLRLIQDKGAQKQFYRDHHLPTADFVLTQSRADVAAHAHLLPAFHKLARAGYDGRGVRRLATVADLDRAFEAPGVLERQVPFAKEISVIAARNPQGEVALYPPVEMVFHPEHHLVEYLFAPAELAPATVATAEGLARRVVEALGLVGLLAIEMFVLPDGEVLINEMAPRPHNSGHHTIEANVTSQYQQLLRAILGWPLGATDTLAPAAMINLLGAPGHTGPARYEGLADVLAQPGVSVHLYGKAQTKPFRKMGHLTLVDPNPARLRARAQALREAVRVVAS